MRDLTRRLLPMAAAAAMVIAGLAGAARADTQAPDLAVYAAAEAINRSDYAGQVSTGSLQKFFALHRDQFKQLVAKAGKPVRGNWLDAIADADDFIKMLLYNKASMVVDCAAEAKLDAAALAAKQDPKFKAAFLPCFDKATGEMIKFLASDNSYVLRDVDVVNERKKKTILLSADKFASKCENGRRRDREKALKPYDYLVPKNPASLQLMSFALYNLCRETSAQTVLLDATFK